MIHRDVKPENVLLADDGRVKVADFGLARAVNSETQHTSTGVLIGTVSYLSPELVVDGHADARSDVYAAGVMIYEMLTGQKPHQADSPIQVAYKHVHEDIPPPSRLMPSLPPYVDALVARATARDTSLRPADAGVLLHQVRRVRNALENGVADDPELTADLAPVACRDPFEDTDGQLRAIIDPSHDDVDGIAGAGIGSNGFDDADDVYDQEREPTSTYARSALAGAAAPGALAARCPHPRPAFRRPAAAPAPAPLPAWPALAGAAAGHRAGRRPGRLVLRLRPLHHHARRDQHDQGRRQGRGGQGRADLRGHRHRLLRDRGQGIRAAHRPRSRLADRQGRHRRGRDLARPRAARRARGRGQDARPRPGDAPGRHLSYGRAIGKYSGTVRKGHVVNASPGVGTSLRRDAAVDLVVSKGPKPIEVPDFTGKDADDAEKALEKLGLEVDTTSTYDDEVAKGKVI